MPLVKALGEITVTTMIGHTIIVPPDKPTYVPESVLPFALKQGCVQCTETGEVILQPAKQPKPKAAAQPIPVLSNEEAQDPQKRLVVIGLAIAKLYQDNNTDDFTIADNRPKVKSVERLTGFPVTGNELAAALDVYQAAS